MNRRGSNTRRRENPLSRGFSSGRFAVCVKDLTIAPARQNGDAAGPLYPAENNAEPRGWQSAFLRS
jgi:hypothetical protein